MHNIMVGFDGSRGAWTALRQAFGLCTDMRSRLHLVHVVEPSAPGTEGLAEQAPDALAILDRAEGLEHEEEDGRMAEADGELAAGVRLCDEAEVNCFHQRLYGIAPLTLREQSVAMDMLVLGRRSHGGHRPVGATAAALTSPAAVPTLLCRDEVVPWGRLLVAFEPSPAGGRALRLAGGLAAELNADLDVLVADPDRREGEKRLEYARRALRAYHVEGEFLYHRLRLQECLPGLALDQNSAVVVVADGKARPLFRHHAPSVAAALEVPGPVAVVVP